MSRFIGLVTDYGYSHYTGILRAVIKGLSLNTDIIDIEHEVPSFNPMAGAYVILVSYRWLPRSSIIVGIIDPGVGSIRRALAVEAGDYYFVGPDNGVLYPAIRSEGFKRGVSLDFNRVSKLASNMFKGKIREWRLSYTFHGRDLFGPAAALIALGYDIGDLGDEIREDEIVRLDLEKVSLSNGFYNVNVMYIDKFGNIVLTIRPDNIGLYENEAYKLVVRGVEYVVKVGRTFSDVCVGDLVIYENSFGFVEIAVNQGNAFKKLNLSIGDLVRLAPLKYSKSS
ncbi:MAG: SAM-dependent chlorinase/fluorinase [Acidilobaceae archaeon]